MKLTQWTACGGCAAKWGASPLDELVKQVAAAHAGDGSLLVGLAPFDDAAVYRINDEVALVSTTDFFPPLVDDPDDFGAIAAANALSDVYAMGGRPVLALNVAAFPEAFPPAAISAIFEAAARTAADAGAVVAGGHTIRSEEPIFGLAVQGIVHPDLIWTKAGAKPGDRLVVSKPIGAGIVLAGGSDDEKRIAIDRMRVLNRDAAAALAAPTVPPNAVTDVTGFGLLGHAWEMAERSGCRIDIDADALPLYDGALALAERGVRTGGDARNRAHLAGRVTVRAGEAFAALGFDPQTSGGLLAAVGDDVEGFTTIGHVVSGAPEVVLA